MKNTIKKIGLLYVVLIMSMIFAISANAETYSGECGAEGDNVTWTLDTETGIFEIKGTGDMAYCISEFTVPWYPYREYVKSAIVSDGVTNIEHCTFKECKNLSTVLIPDSITEICDSAFYGCCSLVNITIPDSVTIIGDDAFHYCSSLSNILIPASVTSIGDFAFASCEMLQYLNLLEGIISIGEYAFWNCDNLAIISIPKSVNSIGTSAFSGCDSLISIKVDENNAYYLSEDDVLFNKDKTELLQYPVGVDYTYFEIPGTVKRIVENAFYRCSALEHIVIPDSVTSIESGAFMATGYYADDENWLEGVLYMDEYLIATRYYAIPENYAIKEGTKLIASDAFSSCGNLKNLNIPESVKYMGDYAFYGCCNLNEIVLPDGIMCIEEGTFSGCSSLESIEIPESVTSIELGAFNLCENLVNISLPKKITSIEEGTFSSCRKLKSIIIPDNVTSLKMYAFEDCDSLESISIPSGVNTIEEYVFYECDNLQDIFYDGTIEQWYGIISDLSYNDATVHFIQKDSKTNITISYTNKTVESDIDFSDSDVSFKISEKTEYSDFVLYNEYQRYEAYDISLQIDNRKVQPKDFIIIKTPLPYGYSEENILVYYIDDSGNKTLIDSTVEDGYVFFETDCLGEFAIVDESSKMHEHSYILSATGIATCTENGYIAYTCSCGDTYTETIPATGHKDENGDYKCDNSCGYEYEKPVPETPDKPDTPSNSSDDCSCNCHTSGIKKFFFNFILFFQKLFKKNAVCDCGVAHY